VCRRPKSEEAGREATPGIFWAYKQENFQSAKNDGGNAREDNRRLRRKVIDGEKILGGSKINIKNKIRMRG